jgi:mycothiol synthase
MGAMTLAAGFEARAIDTGDAELWAGLLAAKEKVDQEGVSFSPADLIDELNDPHLDVARDTIGVWADSQMVAYAKVHAAASVIDVDRVRSEGAVHPEWRRRGLGTALMPWVIGRAGELHARRHPDVPGEVNNSAISTNVGADRLLHRFGFEPCRYFFDLKRSLHHPVPGAPRAAGLQVVPFDASMDERLRVTHNEVFVDHWGEIAVDEATWKAWFTGARAFRAESSYLVLDGDSIAAYVLGFEWKADTDATGIRELYIGQVGTRRSYRRRGLARMALTMVLTQAAQVGYERTALGVDADNPTGALGLYKSLGFSVHSKSVTYRLEL